MTSGKTLCAALVLSVAATVAVAEEDSSGRSLMEEGLELFFKGLQDEMAPTLEGLQSFMDEIGPGVQGFLQEMGPKLGAVFSKVEDWSQYHAPEMLPNGDIILRKKTPDELDATDEEAENGGGVEL